MPGILLDPYILETLMRDLSGHDRKPSAFLVYLCLWYRDATSAGKGVQLSLRQMAEATGLSKRAVQSALKRLVHRRLIQVSRQSRTAVPRYTVQRPWARRRKSG